MNEPIYFLVRSDFKSCLGCFKIIGLKNEWAIENPTPKSICLLFRSLRNPFLSFWRLESSELSHGTFPSGTRREVFLLRSWQGFVSVVVIGPEASLWTFPQRRHCRCLHEDTSHALRESFMIEDTSYAPRDSFVSKSPSRAPWMLNVLGAPVTAI